MAPTNRESPRKISVVVPFHNEARDIERCAEALGAQDGVVSDYELLFVDSASTDGSAALLARFPVVTVLRVEARNAYVARNEGIRHASGDWIAFTDADCLVDHRWLAAIETAARDEAVDIVFGPLLASGPSRLLAALHDYENARVEAMIARGEVTFAFAGNMALRAELFERHGIFDEGVARGGDTELIRRIVAGEPAVKIAFQPQMSVTREDLRTLAQWLATKYRYGRSRSAGNVPAMVATTTEARRIAASTWIALALGRFVYSVGRLVGRFAPPG